MAVLFTVHLAVAWWGGATQIICCCWGGVAQTAKQWSDQPPIFIRFLLSLVPIPALNFVACSTSCTHALLLQATNAEARRPGAPAWG